MTTNIKPTQNFVLLQFIPKSGGVKLFLPDGQHDPSGDILVLAVGPDVPKTPPIEPGSKVMLRGDSKLYGVDDKKQTALVDSRWITAVVEDELPLPTDAEIDRVALGNS